jgi:hypothetical protein
MLRNTASQIIGGQLIATADGSNVTSGTTTVYVTKDGGAQASGGGAVTHEGNGFWSYTPTQAETDAAHVAFTFVNALAITATVQVYPVALTDYADALLKRDMSAVTGEASRSPLNALRFLRNKWGVAGTTLTVTKEDDATTAWSATVTLDGAASPITGSDPT